MNGKTNLVVTSPYIVDCALGAKVPVYRQKFAIREGYSEFLADNLPRWGIVEFISSNGWATLRLLSNRSGKPLYAESFFVREGCSIE